MRIREWLDRLAPDLLETLRRFPFASLLVACVAIVVVLLANEFLDNGGETWWRLGLGLATGAVTATAGVLFTESRPASRLAGLVLRFLAPLAAIGAFFVTDTLWIMPWTLPVVSILWLSVSAFTERGHGELRQIAEDRFGWFNQQAAITAVVAIVAFLLIALGIAAIERSLAILFGLDTSGFFYRWVLPVLGFLFTPLYWLATVPRLNAFDRRNLAEPDFLARATGFLGQFVLTPLLLAYALILFAYTVQIAVTQSLPEGMLGWMVLGFVTTGAANWLLLHPRFMRERLLVRIFRRWWFWLTIIPLLLYALAVWIRIDAYGLTAERMMLVAGGLWAAALTLVFLPGRGDIRLIPALAGLILLLFSIGPWNIEHLPVQQQAATFDALLTKGGVTSIEGKPDWTEAEAQRATGAMAYLFGSEGGREALRLVLSRHGIDASLADRGLDPLLLDLGAAEDQPLTGTAFSLERNLSGSIDVSSTPFLLARIAAFTNGSSDAVGLTFTLQATSLGISDKAGSSTSVDLGPWLERNSGATRMGDPIIDFEIGGASYRLVVDLLTIVPQTDGGRALSYVEGTLFTNKAMPRP